MRLGNYDGGRRAQHYSSNRHAPQGQCAAASAGPQQHLSNFHHADGRYADALKRLREALVDKPRVNATWVAPQGVRGVQRALLLLAKVGATLCKRIVTG